MAKETGCGPVGWVNWSQAPGAFFDTLDSPTLADLAPYAHALMKRGFRCSVGLEQDRRS
jgi:hypothetical protein